MTKALAGSATGAVDTPVQAPPPVVAPLVGTATASAFIMACGVITGLVAARSLGPDGRGQLAAMTVWTTTLIWTLDFSLPDSTAYHTAAEPGWRDRLWSTSQLMAILMGGLIVMAGWLLMPLVMAGEHAALAESVRWFLTLYVIPSLGGVTALGWLQGAGRMTALNMGRATAQLVGAVGMLVLLLIGDHSVMHFAWVLLVGNAATWVVAAASGPYRRVTAAPPALALSKRLFRYGSRLQFGTWSSIINVRLDQLLLSVFASATSLGLYVVAVNYAFQLQAISNTASIVMLPDLVNAQRSGTIGPRVAQWYRRMLWATLIGAAGLAIAGVVVIPILLGSAFAAAVPMAFILIGATVMLGMAEVLGVAFRAIDRPDIESTADVIGLVVTVVVLGALLPRFGAYGAAIATVLSYGTTHLYMLRRAITRFDLTVRTLVVPRRDDFDALVRLVQHGLGRAQ